MTTVHTRTPERILADEEKSHKELSQLFIRTGRKTMEKTPSGRQISHRTKPHGTQVAVWVSPAAYRLGHSAICGISDFTFENQTSQE